MPVYFGKERTPFPLWQRIVIKVFGQDFAAQYILFWESDKAAGPIWLGRLRFPLWFLFR